MAQEKTQIDEKQQEQDSRPAIGDAPKLPLWRRLWTRLIGQAEEEKKEQEFEKDLVHMLDENASESFGKRMRLMFTKPSEVQKVERNAFIKELFSLALRSASPFAALHKSVLIGTFGVSQAATASEAISNHSDWSSATNIYIKTRSALADEIAETMPEVEWDMKSSVLDHNVESTSNKSVEFVRSKAKRYSSMIGVIGSTTALLAINPALLALGVPAYLMGRYLSEKRGEIEKIIFPHELNARHKTYRKSFGISNMLSNALFKMTEKIWEVPYFRTTII